MDSVAKKTGVGNAKKRKLSSADQEPEIPSKRRRGKKRSEGSGTEDSQNPFIFKLPQEVLIKIIDYIPMAQWASLEMVGRRFQEVMHELWKRTRAIRLNELTYNEEEKNANPCRILDSALRKFLHRAPNIVSIGGFDEFCGKDRRIRLSTVPLLAKFQHLEAIEFSLRCQDVLLFLETSASRQCFKSFSGTAGVYELPEEEERWNRALGGNDSLPSMHLESFMFCSSRMNSFRFFLRFDWASLKKLDIGGVHIPMVNLISILKQCVLIEHLELRIPANHRPLFAQLFEVLAGLEKLSVLKIIRRTGCVCPAYQNGLVSLIRDLGRHRRVSGFALIDPYNCNDLIVREIAARMPHLKSLELMTGTCDASSKKLLVTELKYLETLKLNSGPEVNGEVIRALVTNLRELKCLELWPVACSLRDFESFADLRKLEKLDIQTELMKPIDGSVFDSWSRLGFGTRLEALRLFRNGDCSANAMIDWIRNLPRLRLLNLTNVTDSLLQAIADSCPILRELKLSRSPCITRDGLQYVIDRCSQLKVLLFYHAIEEKWFPGALKVAKYRKINFDLFTSGYKL